MKNSSDDEKQLIRRAIRKGGLDDLQPVLAIVTATGALEYTMAKAKDQAQKAKDCLQSLPASEHLNALRLLTDIAVARIS
jgi:octaprenyl-diphosphate synthase